MVPQEAERAGQARERAHRLELAPALEGRLQNGPLPHKRALVRLRIGLGRPVAVAAESGGVQALLDEGPVDAPQHEFVEARRRLRTNSAWRVRPNTE